MEEHAGQGRRTLMRATSAPLLVILPCVALILCLAALSHERGGPGISAGTALAGIAVLAVGFLALRMAGRDGTLPAIWLESEIDPLTRLANHRGFRERIPSVLGDAARGGRSVALLSLDLDDFKRINEGAGYATGDEVLRAVAGEIRSLTREVDVVARVGGEEFALLLPDTGGDEAVAIAERIRDRVGRIGGPELEPTFSAGVAIYPSDATDGDTLLRRADSALESAKRAGKNRTRRWIAALGMSSSQSDAREIEQLLAAPRPVVAALQPIASLTTGLVVGYEALARFPGSRHSSPAITFAQAHASGLGGELEAAALEAALAAPGRPPGTFLAVNISPSALTSPAVRRALAGAVDDVVIEITENESIPEGDRVFDRTIAWLRDRGARIAIDDAGAGYAGLRQLMRVQPDVLKLDIALISSVDSDPARAALIDSLVRFAHSVGAEVCAEGIETLDELAALNDLDVGWGQGYCLARPSEEWRGIAPVAADVCRSSLERALRSSGEGATGGDARLVALSAALAGSRTRSDLEGALAMIAAELNSDSVCLSRLSEDGARLETLAENGPVAGQGNYSIEDFPATARVIAEQEVVAVTVGDPRSDRREADLLLALGSTSVLMVPVVARRRSLGMIEVYRRSSAAWTRAEINRARVIANQFASTIGSLRSSASLD